MAHHHGLNLNALETSQLTCSNAIENSTHVHGPKPQLVGRGVGAGALPDNIARCCS